MTEIETNNIINNSKIKIEIINDIVKYILSLKVELKPRRYNEEIQTEEMKEKWLTDTLMKDPALFLEKWGKLIKSSDLQYFEPLNDNYEVSYYLTKLKNDIENEAKEKNNSQINKNKISEIRNRRYRYIQNHPEYFTIEKLQERNPYEYEEYIGQYIPENERVENLPFTNDMSLVERMLFDIDHKRMNDEIELKQEEIEIRNKNYNDIDIDTDDDDTSNNNISGNNSNDDDIIESEDDDDEEYNEEFIQKEIERRKAKKAKEKLGIVETELESENENSGKKNRDESDESLSEDLKEHYYNYFVNSMHQKFINGNDETFNYSTIDSCDDYDDYKIKEQDIHEKYFEDDD